MKKTKKYYLLLLSLLAIGIACTKKEDVKPPEVNKAEFLVGNSYAPSSYGGDDKAFGSPIKVENLKAIINVFLDSCQIDDQFTFNANGLLTVNAMNKKCDPQDHQTEEATWKLSPNQDSLIIETPAQSKYARLTKFKFFINENGFTLESTIKNKDGSISPVEAHFSKK